MITRIVGTVLVVAILAILYFVTYDYDNTPKHNPPEVMQNADDGALRGLKIN